VEWPVALMNENNERNAYAVTSLVSDLKGVAAVQDPVLQNAWGVAFTPAGRHAALAFDFRLNSE
jgi:hypothetical protein